MSRVAKNPVAVPAGVDVTVGGGQIVVKGPLGTLTQALHPSVKVERQGDALQCSAIEGAVNAKAMSGTVRALVNNMVTGVSKGFERKLNLGRHFLLNLGVANNMDKHGIEQRTVFPLFANRSCQKECHHCLTQ